MKGRHAIWKFAGKRAASGRDRLQIENGGQYESNGEVCHPHPRHVLRGGEDLAERKPISRLLDHRDQEIGNLLRWQRSRWHRRICLRIFHLICIALQHIERQEIKSFSQTRGSTLFFQGGCREPARDAELQVHLAELPALLGISEADVWHGPYLHAEPLRLAKRGFRIGLVWGTDGTHFEADLRSASLADMSPLATVPGIRLFSLQFGSHAAQAVPPPAGMLIEDLTAGCRDFADTAAAIAGLNLTISIDTATANLAGAMGAPVWVPLPFVSDFRWSADGTRPKWYPSAKPYRQTVRGDWRSVFVAMANDLAELTAGLRTGDRREGERVGW